MAREGVTYDEVEAICERLMEAGSKPNQRNVRAELGTGSISTILRHINTWMEKQNAANDTDIELPIAAVAAMKKAMADAVELATNQRDAQLDSYKNQVEEDIKTLSEHEERIYDLEQQLSEQKELAERRELNLEKSLAATTKQVEELQAQNATLGEKLEASIKAQEIARTESAKAQLQVERADKSTEKAEMRTNELSKEVIKLKDSLTFAEKEAATASAVSAEQTKAITRLDNELSREKENLKAVQTRYDDLLANSQKRYDELLNKYDKSSKIESAATAKLEAIENNKHKNG